MAKNTKYGLAGLALGVGLSLFSGCTEEEAISGRVLGALVTGSPNTTLTQKAIGYGIEEGSKAKLDSINAEKSANQVNINTMGNLPPTYSIITDLRTGESVITLGPDSWWKYIDAHEHEFTEGCTVTHYHNYERGVTLRSEKR